MFHPAGPFSPPFHQRSLVVHYPLFSEPKAARKTLSRDEKITSAEIFLLWFVSRCCCWNNKNIFVIKDTFYECTSKHFGWLLTWNKRLYLTLAWVRFVLKFILFSNRKILNLLLVTVWKDTRELLWYWVMRSIRV